METYYSVLGYRIDLYFHDYKLTVEPDELAHNDRNIDHETETQKAIEKELCCVFTRINPDEQNFDIFKAINKIEKHLKESSKKFLVENISKRLLELEFQSNHSIKAKALKYVVKKYCHHYKTNLLSKL